MAPLKGLLEALESGSRPKGGVKHIESGIASIGGEHLDSNGGFRFEKIKFVPTEFAERMTRGQVRRWDILVVKDGATTGKTSLVRDSFPFNEAVVNEHVFLCRCKVGIDPRYVFYYLFSSNGHNEILQDFRGAAQGGISQRFAELVHVPLAPLEQQQRIVEEVEKQFSRLDEAVASLKRVKANRKRYKAAVLKAAVEGKLTEDWRKQHPDVEPASKLLERILAERRGKWTGRGEYKEAAAPDASDLPALPTRWTWATVDQLSMVVRGASPRPAGDPRYFGGTIPWITVGPITADQKPYLTSVPETVTEAGRERSRYIEPHTLLLTNSGATLGVPKITLIGGCINDGVAALLDVAYPLKLYLLYFLHSQTTRLRGVNQGAAQPNLNTSIIKEINVPLPPHSEQEQIVAEVERRMSVIEELETTIEANLTRADRLRQAILSRAFEGKLVPQISTDEPASVLLSRLGRASALKDNLKLKDTRKSGGITMPKPKAEHSGEMGRMNTKSLYQVLRESEKRLAPDQLFAKAGFGPELIDEFYEELKRETQAGSIVQERPNNTVVYLKVASNANR